MHPPRRYCGVLPRALFAIGAVLALSAAPRARAQATNQAQQAATQKKLGAVKLKIAELARQQRETAARRDSINAQLATQATQLAQTAKALRASEAAIADSEARLLALAQQRDTIKQRLAGQRAALADLLRAAYALGRGSDLRLLLGDADVARIARALTYSHYFQHDRTRRIHALLGDLSRLDAVQATINKEQQALTASRDTRRQQMQTLGEQRAAQRALLAQVQSQYENQGQRLRALHDDQQALTRLLEKLRDVFADIPVKLPADTPFAQLRGALPWPAHGVVRASGNGIRIAAGTGSTVHAVAHGRVAYADWLRGYGMLVIIDHGQGWMSLYGDNETLTRAVGDWVEAGDAVGTAGATSGVDAGVYFELRHAGKPVNPRPWLSKPKH